MAATSTGHEAPWRDRFSTPTAATLMAGLEKPDAELMQAARERLREFEGATERVAWCGIPWRWCFDYRTGPDGREHLAYLIPEPGRPQIAIPLPVSLIEDLSLRRLSRPVRDGLLQAKAVSGALWPEWPLASASQLDELIGLVRRKHDRTGSGG